MIDMNKEVIFRDGWTLDGEPLDNRTCACAFDAIRRGYEYGLILDQFEVDSEMIFFEWRGTKKALSGWYTYVSVNMTHESEEERNKTLEIIANK